MGYSFLTDSNHKRMDLPKTNLVIDIKWLADEFGRLFGLALGPGTRAVKEAPEGIKPKQLTVRPPSQAQIPSKGWFGDAVRAGNVRAVREEMAVMAAALASLAREKGFNRFLWMPCPEGGCDAAMARTRKAYVRAVCQYEIVLDDYRYRFDVLGYRSMAKGKKHRRGTPKGPKPLKPVTKDAGA